jgi:F1F0 ATPase subunit 2
MNDIMALIMTMAVIAGILLGTIFFGGLWWTVQNTVSCQRKAFWLSGSLLLLTSITLAGFLFFSGGHWQRSLACLLGFILAGFVVMRLTGLTVAPFIASRKVLSHATVSLQKYQQSCRLRFAKL